MAELFQCSVANAVRRKIAPPPRPGIRIAAIHRDLAALHLELATLLETGNFVPASPPRKGGTAAEVEEPSADQPKGPHAVVAPIMRAHVERSVPPSSASADDLRTAVLAVLQNDRFRASGVHIGLFGSLVGAHIADSTSLRKLVPGALRTWCLTQADAAGILVEPDAMDPSILRRTASRLQKDAG